MSTRILLGDCRDVLRTLPMESVHCVVTSPPYFGLRDYGCAGQIGLEPTPDAYVAELVAVFCELRRVLRKDGTAWLNLGDSYNNRTKVRTTSHQPALNGFTDDNWAERASRGGVRMSRSDGDLKEKDLLGIPWMVAFALRADGWWLRQDIIWSKPNPMPESVTDRCTKAHEYLFMLSKSARYYYDAISICEPATFAVKSGAPISGEYSDGSGRKDSNLHRSGGFPKKADKQRGHGRRHAGFNGRWDAMEKEEQCSGTRNKRSVWEVATQPFSEAHFATFPPSLIEPCIKAGCPIGGTILDPFGGAGTTGLVADRLGRHAILIELNPEYAAMAERRITSDAPLFANCEAS